MRTLAYILAFVFLSLATEAFVQALCNQVQNCSADECCMMTDNSCSEGTSEGEDCCPPGGCSTFQSCCCFGYAELYGYKTILLSSKDITLPSHNSTQSLSDYVGKCWRPPKFFKSTSTSLTRD